MSDLPRRPSWEGAVGAAPASAAAPGAHWRRFSVIACPRQRLPLQMLDAHNVGTCAFRDHHHHHHHRHGLLRPHRHAEAAFVDGQLPEHQKAAVYGDRGRHAPQDPGHYREVMAPPSPAPSLWSPHGPTRVPPLKGHLSHVGGPLGPATDHLHRPPLAPPPQPLELAEQRPGQAAPGAWMPTARRLLLEPAPRRTPVRSAPYGGPALRAPGSAFHRVERSLSDSLLAPYYCSDLVYGVPVYGGLVMPLEAPPRPSSALPPSTPRPHVLRVLRPEELELKVPALGRLGKLPPALPAAPPDTPPAASPGAKDAAEAVVADIPGGETAVPAQDGAGETPKPAPPPGPGTSKAAAPGTAGAAGAGGRTNKRQWLLRVVRENFNEQIGLLVERFVRRPRHDKSVRRVPGIGRKVNVNLQEFWRRSSNQERHMKTKDLLGMYSDSGMDWKAFQKWLTKDLQFMPSCAKLCALSLDIYQRYWSTDWDDSSG